MATKAGLSSSKGFLKMAVVPFPHPNGFILPLVLGSMAVLVIFFTTMSLLTHGQTQAASHFLDSARSLAIAKAGAEWAVTAFASGTYRQNEFAGKDFYDTLFSDSTANGEFLLQHPIELNNYVEKIRGKLEVTVKVYDVAPLPVPAKGFHVNPNEKSGKMEFSAVGTVGKASRRVCIRKGFKIVMMVHPVLSKFTLFVREKPDELHLNVLERKTMTAGFTNGSPIILNNQGISPQNVSYAFDVVNLSTQEFDLSRVPEFSTIVRKSGWVFLNSPSAQPWTLNLSGSGIDGNYDDRLLLRAAQYSNPFLKSTLTLVRPTGERITDFKERFQGMKSDFEVNSVCNPTRAASEAISIHYLFPNAPPKVSLIRPFGTGSQFSPTLIFGPVEMKYLILRGIDVAMQSETFSNVLIPGFPDVNTFKSAYKPGKSLKFISGNKLIDTSVDMDYFALFLNILNRNNAGPSFPAYSNIMTTIATSPYIDALDYICLDARETGTLLAPRSKTYRSPIPKKVGDVAIPEIQPWVGNRNSLIAANGTFGGKDIPLFSGNLADIEGCKEFQSKVTMILPSFQELKARFLENSNQLRLPGIVFIGHDDVIIDTDLQINSTGVLLCGGNITIRAPIKSRFPVTLVSFQNISVETTKPIEAHLICLAGKFKASNGFNIKGGLAARSLDMAGWLENSQKNITFEPAHDPFSNSETEIAKTSYQYHLSREEEYFVEGGK
jgi:hypothetical protein